MINTRIANTWQEFANAPLMSVAVAYETLQQHWHTATHQSGLAWLPETHSWFSVTLDQALTIINSQS